jgi:hypothetical protein
MLSTIIIPVSGCVGRGPKCTALPGGGGGYNAVKTVLVMLHTCWKINIIIIILFVAVLLKIIIINWFINDFIVSEVTCYMEIFSNYRQR